MMSGKNSIITELFDILKDEKILTQKDLIKFDDCILGSTGTYNGSNFDSNLWVIEIYGLIDKLLQKQKEVLANQQKYIVSSVDNEEYLKYMCLFPSSSVVITDRFEDSWPPSSNYEEYVIPKEFLIKLLNNKELLINNDFCTSARCNSS